MPKLDATKLKALNEESLTANKHISEKQSNPKRDKGIHIRLSSEDLKVIDQACKDCGATRATFVRMAALQQAKKMISI